MLRQLMDRYMGHPVGRRRVAGHCACDRIGVRLGFHDLYEKALPPMDIGAASGVGWRLDTAARKFKRLFAPPSRERALSSPPAPPAGRHASPRGFSRASRGRPAPSGAHRSKGEGGAALPPLGWTCAAERGMVDPLERAARGKLEGALVTQEVQSDCLTPGRVKSSHGSVKGEGRRKGLLDQHCDSSDERLASA
jgi:hypothetical protein